MIIAIYWIGENQFVAGFADDTFNAKLHLLSRYEVEKFQLRIKEENIEYHAFDGNSLYVSE